MLDSTSPFRSEILTEEIRRPEVPDEPSDRRMSLWPVANRSFLHGDRKSFAPPERVVYATLDSLALKRARLPLQLLPVRPNAAADCDVPAEDEGNCEQQVEQRDAPEDLPPSSDARVDVSAVIEGKAANHLDIDNGRDDKRSATVARAAGVDQCDDAAETEPDDDHAERRSSCSDYERIEVPCSPVRETVPSFRGGEPEAGGAEYASVLVRSVSPSDPEAAPTAEKLTGDRRNRRPGDTGEKKKKRFAKNVLQLVPDYLAKGSKRARRKKKAAGLSSSLGSLKTTLVEPTMDEDLALDLRHRSRSLSREELRYLKISSPTNFVHVASATSPSLVSNENRVEFGSEQLPVITHEEKCATVPLLVQARTEDSNENRSDAIGSSLDRAKPAGANTEEGVDEARREFLQELRARSAEVLERSQLVKTGEPRDVGDDSGRRRGKTTPEPARVNRSFLWSDRAKCLLKNQPDHPGDDEDSYDDVGLLGPIRQEDEDEAEENYDDVVAPWTSVEEPIFADFDDGVYDDVVSFAQHHPTTESSTHENKENKENNGNSEKSKGNDEDHYLSIANEYSSVEEEDVDEMEDCGQGLYDDVGLPTEERVNSLYAGSTTGSILGKESEWEDLEEPSTGVPPLPSPGRDDSWPKGAEATTTQLVSSKKKAGQKWSRKIGRQRSRLSRKSCKSTKKLPIGDTTIYDNASDDSTYESLRSFQPDDDFSSSSEPEPETGAADTRIPEPSLEAPTRPNPPPPREASLTQTLGRRIKMLRRTWSITKGSLGRMRRRTSAGDEHEDAKDASCNDHQPTLDPARYFGLARHFKKSVSGLSTFYLNGASLANGSNGSSRSSGDRATPEEPIYSNTSSEPDPYSILADQEPLYQFYAAAAARGAFDSNSESYQEVEDTTPSQSATDLVRPGHRTLWCHTPQVSGSDLLQRLSADERKIQEAKFEILTSEASFLNSLRVLENEFLNETSINEMLTPPEKEKLFGGIPAVLHASEQFLAELEAVWRQDPMLRGLSDVLLKYADKCSDIYVAYCSNQVSIDTTLKHLRTRRGHKFFEAVAQVEARPACHSLSLHSFLMLPMQRITRLPLLADAVLSKLSIEHAERSRWETVLSSLSCVVAECNEGARAAAKEVEMENLTRRLEYSSKVTPIPLKGKHLVKSGPVVQLLTKSDAEYKLTFGKKFNKTPLYLLLLTDYLLVAKYKSNTQDETYSVIDACKRSLIALESAPEDSPFGGRHAMLLTLLENYSGRQAEYVLTCDSDTEKQRWLEAVSPLTRGLMGETLYEVWDCPQVVALYSYSSIQPDELSLHPGDVINVFRKMSDGWFHGEKLLDGEQGWFPGNYTKEVASEHVRARNLKQRHRLLALNGSALQRKAKQQSAFY
ncbi:ephexin isoform X2 [Nomia melanderi]|uniref:ephexin isoform X2 n=1 Tax=Nomia melanderi TaxID=2448451 RepID=UPI0013044A4F|nr:uncharacterized protein LOC116428179 [Nomia melanderi]XP_031835332.1 uncharacterized protein LOC116428179 [Nomia melanderi]XP_031835333.1 uncharacterized protein LOC116428179 [Nomia melanderi]XP_031835334.1 uncharacterized protein LOC116428179 [Nomia melanderi]XP_031835335.1 uncharacterized protein LOC116428179 [Nomia melanderi]XP_031835336.1 uncharacterized protein LOC116428179 [Nomia melanderi]XP_031835337.1 uncharacterized protein LOC116428179 [Nomia melanderi]XP_031835338.1 uncharacte